MVMKALLALNSLGLCINMGKRHHSWLDACMVTFSSWKFNDTTFSAEERSASL